MKRPTALTARTRRLLDQALVTAAAVSGLGVAAFLSFNDPRIHNGKSRGESMAHCELRVDARGQSFYPPGPVRGAMIETCEVPGERLQ